MMDDSCAPCAKNDVCRLLEEYATAQSNYVHFTVICNCKLVLGGNPAEVPTLVPPSPPLPDGGATNLSMINRDRKEEIWAACCKLRKDKGSRILFKDIIYELYGEHVNHSDPRYKRTNLCLTRLIKKEIYPIKLLGGGVYLLSDIDVQPEPTETALDFVEILTRDLSLYSELIGPVKLKEILQRNKKHHDWELVKDLIRFCQENGNGTIFTAQRKAEELGLREAM